MYTMSFIFDSFNIYKWHWFFILYQTALFAVFSFLYLYSTFVLVNKNRALFFFVFNTYVCK